MNTIPTKVQFSKEDYKEFLDNINKEISELKKEINVYREAFNDALDRGIIAKDSPVDFKHFGKLNFKINLKKGFESIIYLTYK